MQIPLSFRNNFGRLLIPVYQKPENISRKEERKKRKERGTEKHHNLFKPVHLLHSIGIFCAVKLGHKHTARFCECAHRYQKKKSKLICDIDRAHFYIA